RILERHVGCCACGGRARDEEQAEGPRDAAGRAGHGAVRSDESRKRSYLRTKGHQIASAMPRLTICSTTARTSPPELRYAPIGAGSVHTTSIYGGRTNPKCIASQLSVAMIAGASTNGDASFPFITTGVP